MCENSRTVIEAEGELALGFIQGAKGFINAGYNQGFTV